MIKRLIAFVALGVLLSGCYMAPLALVGPAASGFSSASLIQSGIGASGNYMMKKTTGKSVTEHILEVMEKEIIQQSYFPKALNRYKSNNPH